MCHEGRVVFAGKRQGRHALLLSPGQEPRSVRDDDLDLPDGRVEACISELGLVARVRRGPLSARPAGPVITSALAGSVLVTLKPCGRSRGTKTKLPGVTVQ